MRQIDDEMNLSGAPVRTLPSPLDSKEDQNLISAGGGQEHPSDDHDGEGDGDGLPPVHSIDGNNLEELMNHLNRSGKHWSDALGEGTTLTVKFPQSVGDLTDHYSEEFSEPNVPGEDAVTGFSPSERAAIIAALNAQWGGVADITFVDSGTSGEANLYLFGRHMEGAGGRSGGVSKDHGTMVRLNTDTSGWNQFDTDEVGYDILLHEVGHAIGLSHPGPYNASDPVKPTYENNAEYIQDTQQYTVMSYFGMEKSGATYSGDPIQTIRSHDMWIAQKLYGANEWTRMGDTTYGHNVSGYLEGTPYEFSAFHTNPVPYVTIYDAHGDDDWLDLTLDPFGVTLNLNPGAFSSTHGETNNISLAHLPPGGFQLVDRNAYIENARGSLFNDTLIGNAVDNRLEGLSGNDTMLAGDGDDELIGGTGDDYMLGGFGTDFFDGGEGFDTVDFSHSDVDWTINLFEFAAGSASNDFGSETLIGIEAIQGSKGDDTINGSNADNWLQGGLGHDVIDGDDGDDTLLGHYGNDRIFAGEGNDEAHGGAGHDTLDLSHASGDWEIDMLLGTASNHLGDVVTFEDFENVQGSYGDDEILGDYGGNLIHGGHGIDIVNGRNGDDVIYGEEDDDKIDGGYGNDVIVGGDGKDAAVFKSRSVGVTVDLTINGWQTVWGVEQDYLVEIEDLTGSSYDDVLQGDQFGNWLTGLAGDDELNGRAGNDRLEGGDGDDLLEGGDGDDLLLGGTGVDLATYTTATAGVVVSLAQAPGAGPDHDTGSAGIDSYFDIEGAIGSDYADEFYGDSGANEFHGGNGNDYINGNQGADEIRGGDGNDDLNGGLGNDVIDGGDGVDWVRFSTNAGVSVDLSKTQQVTGMGSDYIVNIENVSGLNGDDELRGNDEANEIHGLGGDDLLFGGGAEDVLRGGQGNDVIYAGLSDGDRFGGADDFKRTEDGGDTGGFDFLGLAGTNGLQTDVFEFGAALGETRAASTLKTPGGGEEPTRLPLPGGADDFLAEDGSGPDRIVFENNWGHDEVYEFTAGGDVLDFALVSGLNSLVALSIADTADGALISYGEDSVLLYDVFHADLSDGDFIL